MNGKLRAYFELLRFPAVFTAVADVMMGYLVTHGDLPPGARFCAARRHVRRLLSRGHGAQRRVRRRSRRP